jgi:GTP cyclohydrolase I
MTTRGVRKDGVSMVTSRFTGAFDSDDALRNRFLDQIRIG